uniref:Uncharacterized protein n=1 Tax=viral metagenome TaxID=1070528 RepID=A0A6C0HHW8_9ZZZZ
MDNQTNSQSNELVIGTITKERSSQEFVENVKKWVLYDQQLKIVKERTDKIRDMKHILGSAICTYMDDHNLTQNEIEITNGKLKIYEKKEYSPLTFSYIEKCLAKLISDKTHVEYIIQYLKENREIKTTTDLKSIYKNK